MKLKKDPNFQAAQVSLAHKHLSFFPPKAENVKKDQSYISQLCFTYSHATALSGFRKDKKEKLQVYILQESIK